MCSQYTMNARLVYILGMSVCIYTPSYCYVVIRFEHTDEPKA